MDIIDNLIYATKNDTAKSTSSNKKVALSSDFINLPTISDKPVAGAVSYTRDEREDFVQMKDPVVIENAFEKHWYDISDKLSYLDAGAGTATKVVSDLSENPVYHMIYAYLIENTRVAQIFEKAIRMYLSDEELGITGANTNAFQWIANSEYLFYKYSGSRQFRNVVSILRPNHEGNRRNAYQRMFGLDLAFGSYDNSPFVYQKAKASNSQFVPLFEQFLSEIWQAYINIKNSSGANASDLTNTADLSRKIGELLRARRGTSTDYSTQNLSREEYNSCFMMSWFHFILSFDSDIVTFLSCQGVTESDRLIKIGNRVGLPAHSKCKALFDLAAPSAGLLKLIEDPSGMFTNPDDIFDILYSPNDLRTSLISIINNWEKATGHKIKNRESNINGTVKIAQIARGTLVTN